MSQAGFRGDVVVVLRNVTVEFWVLGGFGI